MTHYGANGVDYTTTRENWELRPDTKADKGDNHYTTTRENWELRPFGQNGNYMLHYTTRSENWELRLIISSNGTSPRLYHYERKLGTTTHAGFRHQRQQLYHYERKLGTTTHSVRRRNH